MNYSRKIIHNCAAFFLRRIKPGEFLAPVLFEAIAKLTTPIAIEAVCIREGNKGTEVFLAQRPADDLAYPAQWHCPGSILRPGETYDRVFERLEKSEFKASLGEKRFADEVFYGGHRGWFVSKVYVCEFSAQPSGGSWFPVSELPVPMVKGHEDLIIPTALNFYRKNLLLGSTAV
jgi:hypothetical protein